MKYLIVLAAFAATSLLIAADGGGAATYVDHDKASVQFVKGGTIYAP
jgi:hypothetical protein